MAKISPVSIKYMIIANFESEGPLEKPDVIGAIFGQTEGLLGSELEMRELQKEGKVLEPLAELFKDEVRELGTSLGIPHDILLRHPFPGPGLAVRCPGDITDKKLRIIRECDHIFITRLKDHGWYDKVWQAYAGLIPVKTVGVKGDERSYEWAISLRAVISEDAMTADWVELPPALLRETSNRILNEVDGINRVLYDISTKPPASIEWE